MMQQNVPHQIAQSPARLGLPNPNSPSLSNSTPPKLSSQAQQPLHPQQHQSNLSSTSSTSSTLLPLLPPLPRAQSILIQMASLASKLFEVSPNRSQWVSAFRGVLPSFLSTPVDSSALSSPKEILSVFATLQTKLFEAVAELQEILDLQDSKQKLAREIRAKDASLLAFANKLKEAERVLDMLVDDYSYCRRKKLSKSEDNGDDIDDDSSGSSTTTITTHLKLSDILSYAHKISYTTFAPPEFGSGQAPLRGALPPAPQEEQMRASQLYNFADLDVGLPKTDVGKEKTIEPLIETQLNPLSNIAPIPGLLPPNIVVPSGWKPGMPVELPTDLPLPPPGWKPGDPVSLPAMDSLPIPPRIDEQGQLPPRPMPPAATLLRAPEPIQVRHVQLDIDDDSSDYSSDGSSDSED